ncbi:hypothetical protein HYX70_01615 [Candidatus Saccharibacteria bacterium]|nr:hypothetical protein [Candidatus Saccharibacteria bacterium]
MDHEAKLKQIKRTAKAVTQHEDCGGWGTKVRMGLTETLEDPYAEASPCSCLKNLFKTIGVSYKGR